MSQLRSLATTLNASNCAPPAISIAARALAADWFAAARPPHARAAHSFAATDPPGPAAPAPTQADALPVDRLQRAITPQVAESLAACGYAVVDGVFGGEWAGRLRGEVAALRPHMHANCTHLVAADGTTGLLEKQAIHEAELLQQATQDKAPLCAQLQRDATLRIMLSLFLPHLRLEGQAIKLQCNEGGGAFPCHLDTDAAVDTRAVTAIWYLNPGWRPEHGGQLRVYPFPQGPPVDIAPLEDRMVLFASRRMLHRVLPAAAPRYCCTIWLSEGGRQARLAGSGAGRPQERDALRALLAKEEPLEPEEAWRVIGHESIHKHALKWLYQKEWEESILQAHPPSPARDQLVETFWREVGVIKRALAPLLPALRAGPPAEVALRWL